MIATKTNDLIGIQLSAFVKTNDPELWDVCFGVEPTDLVYSNLANASPQGDSPVWGGDISSKMNNFEALGMDWAPAHLYDHVGATTIDTIKELEDATEEGFFKVKGSGMVYLVVDMADTSDVALVRDHVLTLVEDYIGMEVSDADTCAEYYIPDTIANGIFGEFAINSAPMTAGVGVFALGYKSEVIVLPSASLGALEFPETVA